MRGYMVTQGYYQKPEATAQAIDKDGWFHSGDTGLLRPDGHLQFIGRYKDMFVLSDRALLMMDDLRRRMGRENFDAFCRDIFNRHSLDLAGFREAVLGRLPSDAERLRVWLETNDYPEELQLR